jgi:hypothetical protein
MSSDSNSGGEDDVMMTPAQIMALRAAGAKTQQSAPWRERGVGYYMHD